MTLAPSDEKTAAKSPRRRTQEERSATTRKRIIDATLHCLSDKGYASTTLSRITKQAGVSRGALLASLSEQDRIGRGDHAVFL